MVVLKDFILSLLWSKVTLGMQLAAGWGLALALLWLQLSPWMPNYNIGLENYILRAETPQIIPNGRANGCAANLQRSQPILAAKADFWGACPY